MRPRGYVRRVLRPPSSSSLTVLWCAGGPAKRTRVLVRSGERWLVCSSWSGALLALRCRKEVIV
jgi:hypothetical protein